MDIRSVSTYQAGVAQAAAMRATNRLFAKLLREHDLTSMQWFIIGTIYDAGEDGITLTHLSERLQTGLPFITNTINLLETKGIVIRRGSPTDSRSKCVSIASHFREQCMRIEQTLRQKLREAVDPKISRKDLETYLKVLKQLSTL